MARGCSGRRPVGHVDGHHAPPKARVRVGGFPLHGGQAGVALLLAELTVVTGEGDLERAARDAARNVAKQPTSVDSGCTRA